MEFKDLSELTGNTVSGRYKWLRENDDACNCDLDNPHRDWRSNDNEPCPDLEPDRWS